MSGVAHSSYSRRGTLCNGFFAHALDRLSGEALSRKIAGRSRPLPALRDDAFRAHRLGVEGAQSSLDVLGNDSPRVEVVPDRAGRPRPAAPAARRALWRPGRRRLLRHAPACRRLPSAPPAPRSLEQAGPTTPARRGPGEQATARPGSSLRGVAARAAAASLAPDRARCRHRARGEHDLGRQGPPRLALQLDLDSCRAAERAES